MTFDENVLYKYKEKKGSETKKQMGVNVKFHKNSPNDTVVDTQ